MASSEHEPPKHPERPAWLRELDHTGDVALDMAAPTLEELFSRAAWALFDIITDMNRIEPREVVRVTVQAGDRDALLVRWLSELNFLHATQGWLFCDFEVQQLDDRRLRAQARGERYDAARHVVYTEIKAVTFHDLTIQHHQGAWHVQIVFDM